MAYWTGYKFKLLIKGLELLTLMIASIILKVYKSNDDPYSSEHDRALIDFVDTSKETVIKQSKIKRIKAYLPVTLATIIFLFFLYFLNSLHPNILVNILIPLISIYVIYPTYKVLQPYCHLKEILKLDSKGIEYIPFMTSLTWNEIDEINIFGISENESNKKYKSFLIKEGLGVVVKEKNKDKYLERMGNVDALESYLNLKNNKYLIIFRIEELDMPDQDLIFTINEYSKRKIQVKVIETQSVK
jgi:hypothetical protein